MYIQGVANFVDDLLGGASLLALAAVVGSLAWGLFVLHVLRPVAAIPVVALQGCIRGVRRGALVLAAIMVTRLIMKAVVLSSALGELPWADYFATVQTRASITRAGLAFMIFILAGQPAVAQRRRSGWLAVTVATAALVVGGAWIVHAVGRLEDRPLLMSLTVLHQLVAAVWVGGVLRLLMLWRARGREPAAREFFPTALARFSAVGMASVGALVLSGIVLGWRYVGSWTGVIGTAYGSLMATKVVLLVAALGLAALNFRAGRAWRAQHRTDGAVSRAPFYVEAETILLITIMFVAATVSSQPPAVDIRDRTATVSEVAEMFRPRIPSLESPTHEALLAGEPGRVAVVNRVPSVAAAEWSDYNHNVAGIFLVVMALLAYLTYLRGFGFARYWPIGFVLLSIFLFFRSDAETWPLGPIGFWESTLGNGEVLQHRLATVLALVVGVFEMRARTKREPGYLSYMFPALCALGGVVLLTHAHLPFEIKNDYLIQSTHLAMGILAVLLGAGRWLELRLAGQGSLTASHLSGIAANTAMFAFALLLVIYKEPVF